MKIGILSKNYAAVRLFLNKIEGARYKDIRFYNLYLWCNAYLFVLQKIGLMRLSGTEFVSKVFYRFKAFLPTRCSIFHFFNTICYMDAQPWVVSVETAVPWTTTVSQCVEKEEPDFSLVKYDKEVKRALQQLAKPNCKGLLLLSECSMKIQRTLLDVFPEYREQISDKLFTLYPSQELQVRSLKEKGVDYTMDKLTFVFVASDFYRKGGRETLKVLCRLRKGFDFRLILISAMRIDDDRYLLEEGEDRRTLQLIEENKAWIEFHRGLPNADVLEQLKKAHVALLPTWMDTFAYSVLECQACGTPVISTALRALTEINDEKVGWLVKVPVNTLNHPLHETSEQKNAFAKELNRGLEEKVRYVLTHKQEIKEKAKACIERIAERHATNFYNQTLKAIYEGSITDESVLKVVKR